MPGAAAGDRAAHVDVVVAVEVGVDAPLERDLGGAERLRLCGAGGDVLQREQVGLAAEVEGERALREAAEPALERAHVGVVDVAVVHPRHGLADGRDAERVGGGCDRRHLAAARGEQRDDLVLAGLLPEPDAVEHLGDASPQSVRRSDQHRRTLRRARVPRRRTVTDQDDVGAVAGVARARDHLREVCAGIVATELFGVRAIEHREPHRRIEPPLRCPGELRMDREPRREHVTGGCRDLAEAFEVRPRALGVDVIGSHR